MNQLHETSIETVLVTGGSGLVGRAIENELNNKNFGISPIYSPFFDSNKYKFIFLSSKDVDLTNFNQANSVFEFYRPNYVINLAAKVGGLYANMNDNEKFYEINYKINENVLKLSHKFKIKKCFSCLSTCIFPDNIKKYPIDETMIHLGPPHKSNIGYSIAKRQVDLLNTYYNGLNEHYERHDGETDFESTRPTIFTSFIPTNIYGCNDNFKPDESHVIPGLIYKTYESVINFKNKSSYNKSNHDQQTITLNVFGSGKSLRQFIYAPDLAKLILICLDKYNDVYPIILCPNETDEISISQLAELIAKKFSEKFNIKINVKFDNRMADGQIRKTASNEKMKNLIKSHNFQFTPIELGLNDVIDWYCSTYPNIRK